MSTGSRFLATLNHDHSIPDGVSITSVFSRTDEFVWSGDAGAPDPWAASSALDGAAPLPVQDLCPGRPVEHIGLVYDAAVHAVVLDALDHPGPADPARIDRAACLQSVMPGVDAGEAAVHHAELYRDVVILMNEHHSAQEPALAPYATAA